LRRLAKILTRIFFAIFYRVEIINMENVPSEGPALLCSNHNGELDMFFIGYKLKRWVHYIAKEELFKIPVIGKLIELMGAFPVKRGSGDIRAATTVLKLLKQGHIVGIFPEGTRTRGRSNNNIKIKPGIAMFAIKSGVPIIPVAIIGNYRLFSKVRVIFGNTFNLDIDKNKKYTIEEMTAISRGIMDRVYSLMEVT
jgi:1-acyl-sn-glycerol-3-phosphate acyltransferase